MYYAPGLPRRRRRERARPRDPSFGDHKVLSVLLDDVSLQITILSSFGLVEKRRKEEKSFSGHRPGRIASYTPLAYSSPEQAIGRYHIPK